METRGFSAIELLVVLAIGAILLGIAVPGYAFLANSSRLAAATNDLVSAIQLARSEAIKRGMRVTVCKSNSVLSPTPSCDTAATWQQGWLVFVDDGTRGVIDSGDTLLHVHGSVAASVSISASNFNRYISYLPSGVSQGPNNLGTGSLNVCVGGTQRRIIVNQIGRPRLEPDIC
jgi:type IV fimbrial biogenesis protein FimT